MLEIIPHARRQTLLELDFPVSQTTTPASMIFHPSAIRIFPLGKYSNSDYSADLVGDGQKTPANLVDGVCCEEEVEGNIQILVNLIFSAFPGSCAARCKDSPAKLMVSVLFAASECFNVAIDMVWQYY